MEKVPLVDIQSKSTTLFINNVFEIYINEEKDSIIPYMLHVRLSDRAEILRLSFETIVDFANAFLEDETLDSLADMILEKFQEIGNKDYVINILKEIDIIKIARLHDLHNADRFEAILKNI